MTPEGDNGAVGSLAAPTRPAGLLVSAHPGGGIVLNGSLSIVENPLGSSGHAMPVVTVSVALAECPPPLAVISADPIPTALARPVAETPATDGLDEVQVTGC